MKTYTRTEVQHWRDDIAHEAANIAEAFGLDPVAVDNIRQLAKKPVPDPNPIKYEARLKLNDGSFSHWCECDKETFDKKSPHYEVRALFEHPPVEFKDDPFSDGTDAAHPAWWRGNDHAFLTMCGKVEGILDGKDNGKGSCQEPWNTIRQRLIALVKKNKS